MQCYAIHDPVSYLLHYCIIKFSISKLSRFKFNPVCVQFVNVFHVGYFLKEFHHVLHFCLDFRIVQIFHHVLQSSYRVAGYNQLEIAATNFNQLKKLATNSQILLATTIQKELATTSQIQVATAIQRLLVPPL